VLDPREPDDGEPRGKPRRAGLAVLGIPAVAVILAVVLRWSTPMGGLVTYELEITTPKTPVASAAPADGAAPPHVTLQPGQALSLLLRPHRELKEAIEARVFVERQPGSLRRDPVPFTTEAVPASPGAIRLTLDSHQLPARGRVMVLVGRPGSIPAIPAGTAAHGRNWQRFDIDFNQQVPPAPQP
jgi:hypothetical protein